MEKVTLQFQTPQNLTGFRKLLSGDAKFTVDVANLTITCSCSQLDIEKAIKNFGAVIIHNHHHE
jgi:hypothetical protein